MSLLIALCHNGIRRRHNSSTPYYLTVCQSASMTNFQISFVESSHSGKNEFFKLFTVFHIAKLYSLYEYFTSYHSLSSNITFLYCSKPKSCRQPIKIVPNKPQTSSANHNRVLRPPKTPKNPGL